MDTLTAIRSRFTCRAFKPDPVPRATLMEILETALHASSWGNTQPWDLYVAEGAALNRMRDAFLNNLKSGEPPHPELPLVQSWPADHEKRYKTLMVERAEFNGIKPDDPEAFMASRENNYRFFGSPAVVYLCLDRTLSQWSVFDLGGLAQNIMIAAEALGVNSAPAVMLVACPEIIRAELEIPENLKIFFGIALGYADMNSRGNNFRSTRRPVSEVVTFRS